MRHLLLALAAVAVVALFEGAYYTLRFFRDRDQDELRRRLQNLGGTGGASLSLLRQGKLSSNALLASALRGVAPAERLELLLEQAQVGLTVTSLLGYSLLAAVSLGGLGALVAGLSLAAPLALAGLAIPVVVVYGIREKRSLKLSEQLPDALDMMARSLRAGHALPTSFKLVASEMPQPVSIEFAHAFEQQNLGMPLDRAILQMTHRAPNNRDLKIFAVSVVIQKETGGNLVEILEKIAETIRSRYRFFGRLRALTAEGRISALVVGTLPFVAGTFAGLLNPDYMGKLFVAPLGRMILVYGLVSWAVGVLWLRHMSKVDF
jgi:tight adherence protein B